MRGRGDPRWARMLLVDAAETFDPLETAPSVFWMQPNYVAPTWTNSIPQVNGDVSGSNAPAASAGAPVFVSGNRERASGLTLLTYQGNGAFSLFGLVDFSEIHSANATAYLNTGIVRDSNGYAGLYVYRSGVAPYQFWLALSCMQTGFAHRFARTEITSLVAPTTGAGRIWAQGRFTGGRLYVRANGGAWVAGDTLTTLQDYGGSVQIGGNGTVPANGLRGTMRGVGAWKRAITDAESDDLAEWVPS